MYFVSHSQITADNLVWNEIYESFYIFLWIWKISRFGTIENVFFERETNVNFGLFLYKHKTTTESIRWKIYIIFFKKNMENKNIKHIFIMTHALIPVLFILFLIKSVSNNMNTLAYIFLNISTVFALTCLHTHNSIKHHVHSIFTLFYFILIFCQTHCEQ